MNRAMHTKIFAVATIFSVSVLALGASPSSDIPSAQLTGFRSIREADLKANLYFFASDAFLGRMSLQQGDDIATQWIAGEFAKAGLEPAAKDAAGRPSYLQAVPLIEYRSDAEASSISLERSGQTKQWHPPDFVLHLSDDIEIKAPLLFAGYGITAPRLGYDDYKGLDAKGKIVLVFEHEPQEDDSHSRFNGTGSTRYATERVKGLNAQAHGALGMLIVGEPNRKHPSTFDLMARIGGSTARTPAIPRQTIRNDELHIPIALVSDAVGAELLATAGVTPQTLQANVDKEVSNQSKVLPDTSITLHFENKSRNSGMTYNVAGLLRGNDPKLSAETVIFSAHHDHDGWAANSKGSIDVYHGADDNGSGSVGVVALAHAFAANPTRPKRSILFVVFAAEERGLLGAYYMAAHPLRPLDTTRAMINFDMIGRDEAPSEQTNGLIDIPANTSNRLNLIGAAYSPEFKKTVVRVNSAIGLDLDDRFDHEHALNVFFRSDQFPFVLHDIPAFWFFTGFHPDYHHVTDTADKIDYPKMTKILQLSYLSGWAFANEADYPKFVADPPGN
jgi:hypothetical protein